MKKSLLGLGIILALSGCARDANQPLEVWNNFERNQVSSQVGKNQSLVVFYRQDDVSGAAVNLYIDGDYQASLLPNAFTSIAVCADKHLVAASFSNNAKFPNRYQGVNYTLPANEVAYVKVNQDANGQLTFSRVESAVAKEAVSKLPKENQTLSRVSPAANCGSGVMTVETLDAGALFAFNKSDYKDIQAEGRAKILAFAEKVKQMPVSKITVSAHTDPVGSDSYNNALSQQRADTVKKALQQAGVTTQIDAIGYGKKSPVVNCEAYTGAERNRCNMPNRRVEIAVYAN